MIDLIVIGGGAAGIFAAIQAKTAYPAASVVVLERSAVLLAKVRVSGGGRCNVTHHCFEPRKLIEAYPRGSKELLGPFHRFSPRETVDWFETRGTKLKVEADGRMFPVTDCSETIIETLLKEAGRLGVEIRIRQRVEGVRREETGFSIGLQEGALLECRKLILATGSSKEGYAWARSLGHEIEPPVPSLFTFNVPNFSLRELSGVSLPLARLSIAGTSLSQVGPLLITHFGFSGPAALKLSAWAARDLCEKEYKVDLRVQWLADLSEEAIYQRLAKQKRETPEKTLSSENPFHLPKQLWKTLFPDTRRLSDLPLKDLRSLAHKLHADTYRVEGKTTHKEEFVTCGGVPRREVDFRTMESKICPHLFFAGEILDIDGITGGFNFQNAWTTGFVAGTASLA